MSRVRSLSKNLSYTNLKIVDAPWMNGTMRAISNKYSNIDISGREDLGRYRFCYSRGVIYIENKIEEYKLTESEPFNKAMQALQMIVKNRCTVTAYWYELYNNEELNFMKKNNLIPIYELAAMDGFIYLHKNHEHLIPTIRETLINMERDGIRAAIFEDSEI